MASPCSYFIYFIIFLFGLAVGSFLNSIIYRLHSGESFLFKRSYCPYCKHQLSWQDLIPLFSFLILKGKCRYCHRSISIQYPLVELSTGILFLTTFYFLEMSSLNIAMAMLTQFYYLIIFCFLIIIFVSDLRYYIIPNKVIYPAIGIAFIYNLIFNYQLLITNYLVAAVLVAIFFFSIVFISRGKWMGLGDVKLVFFMGLFLGFPNILAALFLAFFLGAIIGIGLIISGKKSLKSEVPFGPFLVIGTFIALFFGQQIINWYQNLFFK